MTGEPLYAGIDLGGTKILALIADGEGRVRGSARVETMAQQGPEPVMARIVEAVGGAARDARLEVRGLRAVGVSAPGPVDRAAGVVTDPPNLPGWHNVALAAILHDRLGVPVVLENDANCGAVGEHQFGAGRGFRDMLYVTVSTGIGGGVIIDGQVYGGASGAAGEVGHAAVALEGPACGAGHPGCLEALASGTAIANRARDAIEAGRLPRTAALADHDPPLSAKHVHQAAERGEAEAEAIIRTAGQYLGFGLANIVNAFNPQAIVVGGGVINMGDAILGPAVETARARSFTQSFGDVRIIPAELGEQAPALGALALARNLETDGAG